MTRLGPTGNFPLGKLNAEDDGELQIAIHTEDGCVRIDFGKPIEWLAFPPQQAIQLGEILIKHAREILQ